MKQVRIAIAASKGFRNYGLLTRQLDKYIEELSPVYRDDLELISGRGSGIGSMVERYATNAGYNYRKYEAYWNEDGNEAGYFRNNAMIRHASKGIGVLFIFWDGKTTSVKNLVELSQHYEVEIHVIKYSAKRR